jgi:hypothetical protein
MPTEQERMMLHLNAFDDFQRDLSYRIFRVEEGLVLTATMKDVFHDIFIDIRVNPETMMISAALVDFLKCPSEFCPRIDRAMAELVGTIIGKGMNKRLVEIFGGKEGCGNIRTILMGLLPLALNAKAAAGIEDQEEMLEKISKSLSGTCVGYPSNY